MQKFLKTAALATAMALIGTAVFAADSFTAKLKFDGNILSDSGMVFNNTGQQDYDDTLHFTYSGDSAGAHFRFKIGAINTAGALELNSTSIWFKPIDSLKITVGDIDADRFKEQIEWWRAPKNPWDPAGWVTADGANGGFAVDFTGVDNLGLTFFLEPGWDNKVLNFKGEDIYNGNFAWGALASYGVDGFGTIKASFQDKGDNNPMQVSIGTDVTAVSGLYMFENIGISFEGNGDYRSVAFDTYLKYTGVDKLTVHAWLPLTLFDDQQFFRSDIKVEYNLGGPTAYFRLYNETDFSDFKFDPELRLGIVGNVDLASLEAWLQLENLIGDGDLGWSVPFVVKLNW